MKLAYRLMIFSLALITILIGVVVAILDTRLYERIMTQRVGELGRDALLVGGQWAITQDPAELARQASDALGGRVTLIDSGGVIVADAAGAGLESSMPGDSARRPEVKRALAGELGVIAEPSGEVERDELYVALRTVPGIVRIGVPTSSLNAAFAEAERDILTAGAVALAVAFMLAMLFAKYVSTPVIELRDMARRMAGGDFGKSPTIDAPGEVGDLADSLHHLSARLETLESVRRDFVANVSHELCSPLTIAGGFAATLAKQDPPPEMRRQFARAILSNTQRMKRVIEDMLDLTRVESGQWAPRPVVVSLEEVIEEVFDSVGPAAAQKGTSLESDIDPDGTVLEADRTSVRQIISNLTENSVRHTTGGRIVVFSERDGDGTWVGVHDTGEGIPTHHLPRIFERMYRVDPGRARQVGGSGLGLAIVKHMAEAHGGRVEAESKPGVGTTIKVFFPPVQTRRPLTPTAPLRAHATRTPPRESAARH